MQQEVIQDFLNVPGIAGIALIAGSAPACFHGLGIEIDHARDAIAETIQQVLQTIPEGFHSFEFEFDLYRVYLHQLNQGKTLLVLTNRHLSRLTYSQAVQWLLIEWQVNDADPIAQFRSLTVEMPPLLNLPVPSSPLLSASPDSSAPSSQSSIEQATQRPEAIAVQIETLAAIPSDLKDVLAAMNAMSRLAAQYLGTIVVANSWKVTRPLVDEWLNHFQVERSAEITFSVQSPSEQLPILTANQYRYLQTWIVAFVERCSKIIRDFTKIMQQALDQQQYNLLSDLLQQRH
jgi:hypothetical protein